jgi:hypothetical protein
VQVHYDEGVAIHIGPEPCAVLLTAKRQPLTEMDLRLIPELRGFGSSEAKVEMPRSGPRPPRDRITEHKDTLDYLADDGKDGASCTVCAAEQ